MPGVELGGATSVLGGRARSGLWRRGEFGVRSLGGGSDGVAQIWKKSLMEGWGVGGEVSCHMLEGAGYFFDKLGLGVVPKVGSGGGCRGDLGISFNAWGCVFDLVGGKVRIACGSVFGVFCNWDCGLRVRLDPSNVGPGRLGLRERAGPLALAADLGSSGTAPQGDTMASGGMQKIHSSVGVEAELEGGPSVDAISPEDGGNIIRFSRRLACKEPSPFLRKVVALKARRDDVEGYRGGGRPHINRNKIKSRSARCGVFLDEGETDSFIDFVSHNV